MEYTQDVLGMMYWQDEGVTRSPEKATLWMEKAARHNDGPAWSVLDFCHEQGTGPQAVNPQKAGDRYRKCAQLQVQECINRLKALQGS